MARQPKNTPPVEQSTEDLIPLTKDGEVIEVHRTCVDDHKRLGWAEVPEEAAE